MAYKISTGKYECSICSKEYSTSIMADSCRDSHEYFLVRMTRVQLNHLIQFIFSKDDKLIDEELVKTLQRYLRNNKG